MVAFSFKARFVPPIYARTKQQTLRNLRKRNARPGDVLQLSTGDRFHPKRLGIAMCRAAGPIHIDFQAPIGDASRPVVHIEAVWANGLMEPIFYHGAEALERFAGHDGFQGWQDLEAFWAETHDKPPTWSGWWTFWGDSFTRA